MKWILIMRALIAVLLIGFSSVAYADPFDECPAKAFLTQGKVPKTFSINLATGDYRVFAESMGTTKPVNGLGFNTNDRYVYGWGYEDEVPVRVHNDFSIEVLPVENIAGQNFYVGDVSGTLNKYYVYRKGANFGLYSIGLDPDAEDYLKMLKVTDGESLGLVIFDMAFHPDDGFAYSVDKYGILHRIDVVSGTAENLADIGERGVYGAIYFDVTGNLYISRNSDGKIFRIAIDGSDYKTELFAIGPASTTNDGSRCALAPIVDVANVNIDFGDAPDSYGTYFESNGARHGLSDNNVLYLGSTVDGESDSSAFPLSDDDNDAVDDEDGVQFANRIVESENAISIIQSSAPGFLNAWIDLDQNGIFDGDDHVLKDKSVVAGKQPVYIPIPAGAKPGRTWSRFRLSSSTELEATGGVSDGEVEDYQVEIFEKDAITNYFPSETGWATIAFEDNWPHEGDYDLNDLVVYLRTTTQHASTGIKHVSIKGEIAAAGAAYHNGFAIRLPGIPRDMVDEENLKYTINNSEVSFRALEAGREEAILIVTYNVYDYVGTGELCNFYRTEEGCGSDIQMSFSAEIPLKEPVDVELPGPFDPFLFATPGAWHGGHFASAPGRGYEIHLKNQAPTEAFEPLLFDQEGDDASDPARDIYFQTTAGLPYALAIGDRWRYPIEYRDIGHAYFYFAKFATSSGASNAYWYSPENVNENLLFTH